MFGRRRRDRKWEPACAAVGMSVVDDPTPWLGHELGVLAATAEASFDAERLPAAAAWFMESTTTRDARIDRAAVNSSLGGPGVLAAVELSITTRSRGRMSRRTTVHPTMQVIIGRLSREIASPLGVVPNFAPGDLQDTAFVKGGVERGLAPPQIEHPLLRHHYASLTGSDEEGLLAGDPDLAALLWALRAKVHGEDVAHPELQRDLQARIPPTERITDYALIELRGDLVAIMKQRPWPSTGLNADLMRMITHVTTHFT